MNRRNLSIRRALERRPQLTQARTDVEASTRKAMLLALALAVAISVAANATAQDGADSQEARNCVDLMRVDHTEVVDDDTVLFYMRNGDVYRNDLKHQCPALASEERFMYRTMLNQLCDVDVITVLQDVGFGFLPAASCGLGKFQPIEAQAAEQLLSRAEQGDR